MKTAHTPTPWRSTVTTELGIIIVTANDKSNGLYLAQVRQHGVPHYGSAKDNAEFIVRAVNNHDPLMRLAEMVAAGNTEFEVLEREARAALAAARGGEIAKKRKTLLTPEEDRFWEKSFAFYIDAGKSDEEADRLAAEETVTNFPRLKEYEVWI